MMANIKSGAADGTTGMARVVTEAGRVKMGGHSDTTEHSFSEEERAAFVDHMNYALQDDAGTLPVIRASCLPWLGG